MRLSTTSRSSVLFTFEIVGQLRKEDSLLLARERVGRTPIPDRDRDQLDLRCALNPCETAFIPPLAFCELEDVSHDFESRMCWERRSVKPLDDF
jgi:hypothetical protein